MPQLDPNLVRAVRWAESRGNVNARSPAGAIGEMQLMPGTAAEMGMNPNNPVDNFVGGHTYLGNMLNQFGNERDALYAYNAGPGRVGNPPAESREYADKVLRRKAMLDFLNEPEEAPSQPGMSREEALQFLNAPDEEEEPGPVNPYQEKPFLSNVWSGAKAGWNERLLGMAQLMRNAPVIGPMYGTEEELAQEATRRKAESAPIMQTAGGQVGHMLGGAAPLAPLMAAPGAGTILGGAVMGGLEGATEPSVEPNARLRKTLMGAGMGGAGTFAMGGLSKIRPEVRALMDKGVPVTPGQIMGRTAAKMEEAAGSIPFLGAGAAEARDQAVKGFNRVTINDALKNIGAKLPDEIHTGHEAIEWANRKVAEKYDDLLPHLSGKWDGELDTAIMDILGRLDSEAIPPDIKAQGQKVVFDSVVSRFGRGGIVYGKNLKGLESDLGREVRDRLHDSDFAQRRVGEYLVEVQDEIRRMMVRANPASAKELRAANGAFAGMLRPNVAAATQTAHQGIFSTEQFRAAARKLDPRIRHLGWGEGTAPAQELAEQGMEVLGRKVPDSGTPYRSMLAAMVGGTLGGGIGSLGGVPIAGGLLGSMAYTKPGISAITAVLAKRPDLLRKLAPAGGLLGASALNPNLEAE